MSGIIVKSDYIDYANIDYQKSTNKLILDFFKNNIKDNNLIDSIFFEKHFIITMENLSWDLKTDQHFYKSVNIYRDKINAKLIIKFNKLDLVIAISIIISVLSYFNNLNININNKISYKIDNNNKACFLSDYSNYDVIEENKNFFINILNVSYLLDDNIIEIYEFEDKKTHLLLDILFFKESFDMYLKKNNHLFEEYKFNLMQDNINNIL